EQQHMLLGSQAQQHGAHERTLDQVERTLDRGGGELLNVGGARSGSAVLQVEQWERQRARRGDALVGLAVVEREGSAQGLVARYQGRETLVERDQVERAAQEQGRGQQVEWR